MLAAERREKILEILINNPGISIAEISKKFNKSIPTIYKDLNALEKKKKYPKNIWWG